MTPTFKSPVITQNIPKFPREDRGIQQTSNSANNNFAPELMIACQDDIHHHG